MFHSKSSAIRKISGIGTLFKTLSKCDQRIIATYLRYRVYDNMRVGHCYYPAVRSTYMGHTYETALLSRCMFKRTIEKKYQVGNTFPVLHCRDIPSYCV